MFVLFFGLAGILVFAIGVGISGLLLRRNPSRANAEKSSRNMNFLFFAGMVAPALVSFISPGFSRLDGLVGLPSLPAHSVILIAGVLLAFLGLYLVGISSKLLRDLGNSANAFRMTKHIVKTKLYKRTRNPMSLGYYLWAFSLGLISNSTLVTLFVLLGFIPAHIFFLKYFEEFELELRFGSTYRQYKEKVPFLIPKF